LLLAWIQANLSLTDALAFPNYLTQYAAPSATGFSIQVTDADDNIYLIITPVAGYAAGTIVLPTSSNVAPRPSLRSPSTATAPRSSADPRPWLPMHILGFATTCPAPLGIGSDNNHKNKKANQ